MLNVFGMNQIICIKAIEPDFLTATVEAFCSVAYRSIAEKGDRVILLT